MGRRKMDETIGESSCRESDSVSMDMWPLYMTPNRSKLDCVYFYNQTHINWSVTNFTGIELPGTMRQPVNITEWLAIPHCVVKKTAWKY